MHANLQLLSRSLTLSHDLSLGCSRVAQKTHLLEVWNRVARLIASVYVDAEQLIGLLQRETFSG